MKEKLYDILDEMQELMYETDAAGAAAELMCGALRERREELAEKMVYFMQKELECLKDKEGKLIEQMDIEL